MNASRIFMSCFIVILIFNVFCFMVGDIEVSDLLYSALSSVIVTAVTIAIIAGINVLGSGLSPSSIRIIFGFTVLITLMFQFDIPTPMVVGGESKKIPVGLGLGQRMLTKFNPMSSDVVEVFGWWLSLMVVVAGVISGIQLLSAPAGD